MVEGEELPEVLCSAAGQPVPSLAWSRLWDGERVGAGPQLQLPGPFTLDQDGFYTCHASNQHGETTAELRLVVLPRPKCQLTFQLLQVVLLLVLSHTVGCVDSLN